MEVLELSEPSSSRTSPLLLWDTEFASYVLSDFFFLVSEALLIFLVLFQMLYPSTI